MFFQILLQIILIAINAFFAATEIALISINEKKVKNLAESGDKKAKKMLKILDDPTKFLSAIQVGITLAGFLGSAFAADNFAEILTNFLVNNFNIAASYISLIDTVSVIVVTLILSYFTLVFGELVPKRIAMRHKESLAKSVVGIMSVLTIILKPIIWFLTASTNLILRLFRIDPNAKDDSVSEEDIVIMLDAGADEGTFNENDIEYIKNVFKLDRLSAIDVMTPTNSLIAISKDISQEELLKLIEDEGYSRIPVFDGDIDNIIGILHVKTFLLKRTSPNFILNDAISEPEFVPETQHLDKLFKKMQEDHTHMVVVVDEFGSTAGIVTMEDILEELVGEIWDEQDEELNTITEIASNKYKVKTNLNIEEFFEFFNLQKDDSIESATVNGWILELCDSIPEEGFVFNYQHLSVKVVKAEDQLTREIEVEVLIQKEKDEK